MLYLQLLFPAARNLDEEGGWMQLLILVVVAVFYAIGSILKAKGNRGGAEEEEEGGSIRLEPQSHPQDRTTGRRPLPSRPAQTPFRNESIFRIPMPAIEIDPPSETLTAPPDTMAEIALDVESTEKEPEPSEMLIDLADSDQWRKAIVYREVLGKPLGLRPALGSDLDW